MHTTPLAKRPRHSTPPGRGGSGGTGGPGGGGGGSGESAAAASSSQPVVRIKEEVPHPSAPAIKHHWNKAQLWRLVADVRGFHTVKNNCVFLTLELLRTLCYGMPPQQAINYASTDKAVSNSKTDANKALLAAGGSLAKKLNLIHSIQTIYEIDEHGNDIIRLKKTEITAAQQSEQRIKINAVDCRDILDHLQVQAHTAGFLTLKPQNPRALTLHYICYYVSETKVFFIDPHNDCAGKDPVFENLSNYLNLNKYNTRVYPHCVGSVRNVPNDTRYQGLENIVIPEDDSYTPMHLFATVGTAEEIKTIPPHISQNWDKMSKEENRPIHLAALAGNVPAVETILSAYKKKKTVPTFINKRDQTPGELAVVTGNKGLVEKLFPERDYSSLTEGMRLAAEMGQMEILECLLKLLFYSLPKLREATLPRFAARSGKWDVVQRTVELVKVTDNIDDMYVQAAAKGGPDLFQHLEENGADPEHCLPEALTMAVQHNNSTAISYLVTQKADVDTYLPNGEKPLSLALQNFQQSTVDTLLAAKASPYTRNNKGRPPFHNPGNSYSYVQFLGVIARQDNSATKQAYLNQSFHHLCDQETIPFNVARNLVTIKANPNSRQNGKTALYRIAEENRTHAAKKLLALKANPKAQNTDSTSTVDIAMNNDTLQGLIKRHYPKLLITQQDKDKALIGAIQRSNRDDVQSLVRKKASLNPLGHSQSPLCEAAKHCPSFMPALIALKADINHENSYGRPLNMAVKSYMNNNEGKDGLDRVQRLLNAKANPLDVAKSFQKIDASLARVCFKPFEGNPLQLNQSLLQLAHVQDISVIKELVSLKANPKIRDSNGQGIEFYCTRYKNRELTMALVEKKANFSYPDTQGNSPLMLAAKHNYASASQLLLDSKANLSQSVQAGLFGMINETRQESIVNVIAPHLDIKDMPKAFYDACKTLQTKPLKKLVDYKASIDYEDYENKWDSPLHTAVRAGNVNGVNCLLALKADPSKLNLEMETPLMIAANNNTQAGRKILNALRKANK